MEMLSFIESAKKALNPYEIYRAINADKKGYAVRIYFFDSNYVWTEKLITLEEFNGIYDMFRNSDLSWRLKCFRDELYKRLVPISYVIDDYYDITIKRPNGQTCDRDSMLFVRGILSKLKPGNDIYEFERLCKYFSDKNLDLTNKYIWSLDPLDRHLGKIKKPLIYRAPENYDKNTFDFIDFDVPIIGIEDKLSFAKKYQKDICKRMLAVLDNTAAFRKYNVPKNVLRLSRYDVTRSGRIRALFELKRLKDEQTEGLLPGA